MIIVVSNNCCVSKISQPFLPIIREVVAAYLEILTAATVKDIRLMGSVPRGDARLFHSDIDFAAICTRAMSKGESCQISECAAILSRAHKQVRKVDLETEVLGQIHRTREFIFRTDSVSIYGESQYPTNNVEIDATELADTTTPNIEFLLSEYGEGLRSAASREERAQLSRWIGKDILKGMRRRLLVEKSVYAKAPKDIHSLLVEHFPEHTAIFDDLLSAYMDPTSNESALYDLLLKVEKVRSEF